MSNSKLIISSFFKVKAIFNRPFQNCCITLIAEKKLKRKIKQLKRNE